VVIAVALFFSSLVVTPTLAGLFTAATFVAGRSSGHLHYFTREQYPPAAKTIARALSWMLPRLDRFNIADQVVYGDHIEIGSFWRCPCTHSRTPASSCYSAPYCLHVESSRERRRPIVPPG